MRNLIRFMAIFLSALLYVVTFSPSANAWEVVAQGQNEIGDRQFIAMIQDGSNADFSAVIAVGCTEGLFELKIASDMEFDGSKSARIRYDSKKAVSWGVKDGPTSSDGSLMSIEFQNSKTIYKSLLTAKYFTVQLVTVNGSIEIMKFNVSGTAKLTKSLRSAGCKV